MKSPSIVSPSSPTGVSRLSGSFVISNTLRMTSTRTPILSASSCGVGSRPNSCTNERLRRSNLLVVSTMCTGMRIVRARSEIAREIACRIHQVA